MNASPLTSLLFMYVPLLLIFYFVFRNRFSKTKGNEYLIHNLDNRGEKLIKENIHGDKIVVKLKGNFGQGLVITDKRLYVVKWGYMTGNTFGGKCTGFEYKNIVGLEIRKGFGTGIFQVLTPSNQESQKSYWGTGSNDAVKSDNIVTFGTNNSKFFQEAVKIGREHLQSPHSQPMQNNQTMSSYSELEKLAELKDKGIITTEEFEAKKKKILDL